MVKLKKKIKIIESLPPDKTKNKNSLMFLLYILFFVIFVGIFLISYNFISPYINAVKIENIIGKKIAITECNTKDYIIINKDKTFSLNLTNENCETNYHEGTLKIKNNEIIFNDKIKGIIDNNYNIIINSNIFESDK